MGMSGENERTEKSKAGDTSQKIKIIERSRAGDTNGEIGIFEMILE